jgi:virginiamycin B lyase
MGGAPIAPDWQTTGYGAVWIANRAVGTVQRIDPTTNRVTSVKPLYSQPCAGMATGFGSIWSANCSGGEIDRIDPHTLSPVAHITASVATDEGQIAADANGVWFISQTDSATADVLERIDPKTNKVTQHIRIPQGSAAVASGFGSEWVTTPTAATVERIDPRKSATVATVKVHGGPRFLVAGVGSVWVLNQSDGSVSKIDPRNNHVAATILAGVPGSGGCIAAGLDSVWLSMPATPLVRIDPHSNRVTERFTGKGGDCLSTGFGSIWLSNHQFGNVWRIRP